MKALIQFSLRRRFNNKATKLFNGIVIIVIGCAFFSDFIMKWINPAFFEVETIYIKGMDEAMLSYMNEYANEEYIFKISDQKITSIVSKGNMVLEKKEEQYLLHSKYELSKSDLMSFEVMLESYHQQELMNSVENQELIEAYHRKIPITNQVINQKDKVASDKSSLIFLFVTSVYFMTLSFVSGVASEVVNEKTTRTLELILTSVSAKEHFFSKLIVGWLMIVVQGIATLSYLLFFLLIRSLYDQASGLLLFVKKLNLFPIEAKNIYALIGNLDINADLCFRFGLVVLFLLIGILLVQLLLVIVSSFVTTIEEAGNIQAPFYLVFLGIYYLVLAINTPYELSEGIGYWLSFIPIFNMLLMPCRILIMNVPLLELAISALGSLYLVGLVLQKGMKWYERGVLDYSSKGFIAIWKMMRNKS